MIKNIYDKKNKQYRHEYFCDNCLSEVLLGKIYRNKLAIIVNKIDLCADCYKYFLLKPGMNKIDW